MKSITSKISIIILSLMACTFTFAEDKPAEEWLFVHTADEAQVTNNTTIVMPVTRDIFAFTDRPYRKHAYMTGEQFASMWAEAGSDSFKTDPPNAVLTWVDGEDVKEAEVVITGASIDGDSITYTRKHPATVQFSDLKSVSLFVDGAGCPVGAPCSMTCIPAYQWFGYEQAGIAMRKAGNDPGEGKPECKGSVYGHGMPELPTK
jgi:hypothetical protein